MMLRSFMITVFTLALLAFPARADNLEIRGTAVDSAGNTWQVGSFTDTENFNPGGTACNFVSAGGKDMFFAKYSPAGICLLAFQLGGTGDDVATGVSISSLGKVAAVGNFNGSINTHRWPVDYPVGTTDSVRKVYPGPGANGWICFLSSTGNGVMSGNQVSSTGSASVDGVTWEADGQRFNITGFLVGTCVMPFKLTSSDVGDHYAARFWSNMLPISAQITP